MVTVILAYTISIFFGENKFMGISEKTKPWKVILQQNKNCNIGFAMVENPT